MQKFWWMLFCLFPAIAFPADFGNLNVQIHGTLAQGGLLSSHNDFLAAPTNHGTLQWTDAALNVAKDFIDRFHAGIQLHTYRLGELGKFKVEVDWAYGEYRFADWVGVRAGKVKTRLGLFNDTQDIDALHLWSLLPQGVYPADNRSWTLAHTGGDVFGNFKLPSGLGRLSYQGYLGRRVVDPNGGYFKAATDEGFIVNDEVSGILYGGDLRWFTPFQGLTAGGSLGLAGLNAHVSLPQIPVPFSIQSTSDTNTALYAEFERGKFYAAGEFRRRIWNLAIPEFHASLMALDCRAWYLMGAYRVHRILQIGAYYSSLHYPVMLAPYIVVPNILGNGTSDWVVAARVDPNPHVYFKFEGHYMDGTMATQGFYPSTNPGGADRLTRLLVARIGLTF
jgi:hypothetical protein